MNMFDEKMKDSIKKTLLSAVRGTGKIVKGGKKIVTVEDRRKSGNFHRLLQVAEENNNREVFETVCLIIDIDFDNSSEIPVLLSEIYSKFDNMDISEKNIFYEDLNKKGNYNI